MQGALCAVSLGHSAAIRIQNRQMYAALPFRGHAVTQRAVGIGYQRDVADVGGRGRIQTHGAGNARVVEEVEVGQVDALHLLARLAGLHGGNTRVVGAEEGGAALVADGQCAVSDAVVHLDLQRHSVAGVGQRRDVNLKGQKSAAVGRNLLPVQPHGGVVGYGVKAQHTARALRYGELGAVVRHTVVTAELRVGALVVVGGRHCDGLPRLIGIKTEIPHAGQIADAAGSIGLRIHRNYLSSIMRIWITYTNFPLGCSARPCRQVSHTERQV